MSHSVQYTIRNVPPALDAKLKAQAKRQGISLNKLLLKKIGVSSKPKSYHDLDFAIGSMTVQEAKEFDRVISKARNADRERAEREFRESQQ